MKRFKIVGLCLVAMFAFSAVGAASASAAHWYTTAEQATGGITKSHAISTEPITITGGKLEGDGIKISCPTLSVAGGKIETKGEASAEHLTFTGCKVENAEHCVFEPTAGTIKTEGVHGQLQTNEKEIKFSPKNGLDFVIIEVGSEPGKTCLVEGEYEVTGSANVLAPKLTEHVAEHFGEVGKTELFINPPNEAKLVGKIETTGKGLKLSPSEAWWAGA